MNNILFFCGFCWQWRKRGPNTFFEQGPYAVSAPHLMPLAIFPFGPLYNLAAMTTKLAEVIPNQFRVFCLYILLQIILFYPNSYFCLCRYLCVDTAFMFLLQHAVCQPNQWKGFCHSRPVKFCRSQYSSVCCIPFHIPGNNHWKCHYFDCGDNKPFSSNAHVLFPLQSVISGNMVYNDNSTEASC